MNLRTDAKEVYEYAYSLMMTEAIHWGSDDKGFEHCREFPTSEYKRITKLNMDTLYSYAWTQLANTPYLIHIPKITERYFLFPIMDAYGDVIYSIGTRTPELSAGDYIFLYQDEPVPKGYENYRVLRSRDSLNSVLLRIETRGKSDYALVHKIQDSITIKPLYEERVQPVSPSDGIVPADYLETIDASKYFADFAKLAEKNPIHDEAILKAFERLGYQRDTGIFDYASLSEEQKNALKEGSRDGLHEMKASEKSADAVSIKNGWVTLLAEVGRFGNDYCRRAASAREGWGGNIVEDTLYSVAHTDIDGRTFESKNSYRLHFNQTEFPHAAVFWSVTLYGEPGRFPVKNKIDRFSVNTYDVEQKNVELNPDGSLDLYISAAEPTDAHERKNWLPAPTDEKGFTLAIRNYWPDEMSLKGEWNPPIVKSFI